MNRSIAIVCSLLTLTGCAQFPETRLGQFTAASSFNVRNLSYDSGSSVKVTGEDCHAQGDTPNDARLQRAMDMAIKNGQKGGFDGDLLVNVRIDQKTMMRPGFLGLPSPHRCLIVEGDLVKLKTS
jgi:hypothetical protein